MWTGSSPFRIPKATSYRHICQLASGGDRPSVYQVIHQTQYYNTNRMRAAGDSLDFSRRSSLELQSGRRCRNNHILV